jgi:hypothetical protein
MPSVTLSGVGTATAPAAGYLAAPIAALRTMLATSAAFRDWVSADDEPEALASIYVLATPKTPPMPFALIDIGDWSRERVAVMNGRRFQTGQGSRLVLYFRAAPLPPAEDQPDEPGAAFEFMQRLDAVIADLEIRAGLHANRTLAITEITLAAAPARIATSQRATAGDYYEAAFTLQWSRQP